MTLLGKEQVQTTFASPLRPFLKGSSKMELFSWPQTSMCPWSCKEWLREQSRKARMESALELLLSLGSELLGQDPSSPSTFLQQTNHHTGTAPQIHLSQHPDTDIAHVYSPLQQGIFQGKTEEVSQTEWAFPRHRLEFEAIHSWDLSHTRLCKQTVAFDCHWLFLSLFSHFLKSLT